MTSLAMTCGIIVSAQLLKLVTIPLSSTLFNRNRRLLLPLQTQAKACDYPPVPTQAKACDYHIITPLPHYPTTPLSHHPIIPLSHYPIIPSPHYPITPLSHHPIIPSPHYPITPLSHHPITPYLYLSFTIFFIEWKSPEENLTKYTPPDTLIPLESLPSHFTS